MQHKLLFSESRQKMIKSASVDKEEDAKSSTCSSVSGKTPRKVKAEAAARKAKSANNQPVVTSLTDEQNVTKPAAEVMSLESDSTEISIVESEQPPAREVTPDIIRKSPPMKEVRENDCASENEEEKAEKAKKMIIQSEEEAKARLAEKRKEMKEKMEREAEMERQKQLELERLEIETRAREEEEERKAIEEAERVAEEAKRVEEARLQKAIEEAKRREEDERRKKEEEESRRREAEKKAEEEAKKKQEELDEKLRKDEEERLARKKRLEEIMSRTRGNKSANSTPKKVIFPGCCIFTVAIFMIPYRSLPR